MKKVVSQFIKHFLKPCPSRLVLTLICMGVHSAWADDFTLGIQLYERGQYQAAAQALQSAVNEQGQNPNIRYYLADTYLKLNRLNEAQAEYQQIMSIAPASQAARLSRIALTHLRETQANRTRQQWSTNGLGKSGGKDLYTGPISEGDNYLDEVLDRGRIIRWSLLSMPIKVYIERSPSGIRNFQPSFVDKVQRALAIWANVLNHQFSYELVNAAEQADIRVRWVNTIDTQGKNSDGGTAYTAGLMEPTIRDNQIQFMSVKLATFDIYGKPQTESLIQSVAIHELGHALGLLGHSSNPNDIMSAENQSVSSPSQRDINTIRRLYTLQADVNNHPASEHPQNAKRATELAEKLDEAIKKSELLASQEDTALTWLNLGVVYYQKAKEIEKGNTSNKLSEEAASWYKKALTATNQAIQREPKDPKAYQKRCLIYQELGDYNQALLDIEKAISFDRRESDYYLIEAWCLAKLKRTAQARSALDTYLLHRPGEVSSPDVKLIQEELRRPSS